MYLKLLAWCLEDNRGLEIPLRASCSDKVLGCGIGQTQLQICLCCWDKFCKPQSFSLSFLTCKMETTTSLLGLSEG